MRLSKQAIEALWREFADCPVNDHEEILEPFCGWPVFTDREEIWRWFDEQYAYNGGVHALMYPEEHHEEPGTSPNGIVMAYVSLQTWCFDYTMDLGGVEFDCALALDGMPLEFVKRLESGRSGYDTDDVYAEAVHIGLVEDHDGPFDCAIKDQDELDAYIRRREERTPPFTLFAERDSR